MAYVPNSVMEKIRPALNWVGRKISYKRKPSRSHKVWVKVEYDCIGMVLDVSIDKKGVRLYTNCIEHEDHKETWKAAHLVSIVNEDGTLTQAIKPTDASYAFRAGGAMK